MGVALSVSVLGGPLIHWTGPSAQAQSAVEQNRLYSTRAGQEVRIGRHAVWNRHCQTSRQPLIRIVAPPRNGSVVMRPATVRIHHSIGSTNCDGREVPGVGLFYAPNAGFRGQDTLRYTADIGSALITATVTITVE